MIQSIITRMEGNLFLLKGWALTLIVALLALLANRAHASLYLVSVCILFVFWVLDGYFLSLERCFRGLFDEIRTKKDEEIDFAMNFKKYMIGKNTWMRSMFSVTLNIYYGVILLIIVSVFFFFFVKSVNVNIAWKNNNPSPQEVKK